MNLWESMRIIDDEFDTLARSITEHTDTKMSLIKQKLKSGTTFIANKDTQETTMIQEKLSNEDRRSQLIEIESKTTFVLHHFKNEEQLRNIARNITENKIPEILET